MSSSLKLTALLVVVVVMVPLRAVAQPAAVAIEEVDAVMAAGGNRTIVAVVVVVEALNLNDTSEFIGMSSSCWMSVRRGYWKRKEEVSETKLCSIN